MLSLLGSLLGFGTSFLPKVMDYFQDRQDKAHELAVMTRQMELQLKLQEAGAAMRLAEINVDADIRETEALHREQVRITLNLSVKAKITDGRIAAIGRLGAGFYIYGNDVSKEDIEREYVKAIVHALQYLHFEEERNG